MRIKKLKTFYRIQVNPQKYERLCASDFDNLRRDMEAQGVYHPEHHQAYEELCRVFLGHDLTDTLEYLEKHSVLAELKGRTIEAEFVGENGRSVLMPRHIRNNLLSEGISIEKVTVVENLDRYQFFWLEIKARKRNKTIFPLGTSGEEVEIIYKPAPADGQEMPVFDF